MRTTDLELDSGSEHEEKQRDRLKEVKQIELNHYCLLYLVPFFIYFLCILHTGNWFKVYELKLFHIKD